MLFFERIQKKNYQRCNLYFGLTKLLDCGVYYILFGKVCFLSRRCKGWALVLPLIFTEWGRQSKQKQDWVRGYCHRGVRQTLFSRHPLLSAVISFSSSVSGDTNGGESKRHRSMLWGFKEQVLSFIIKKIEKNFSWADEKFQQDGNILHCSLVSDWKVL